MKTTLFAHVLLLGLLSRNLRADYVPSPLHFEGRFETTYTTSPECNTVFDELAYNVSHYLVGANHRTSVVHFSHAEKKGFFDNISLVGLFGYQNDFQVSRQFRKGGFDYNVLGDGIVSAQLIAIDLKIEKFPIGNAQSVCEATGTISAFH